MKSIWVCFNFYRNSLSFITNFIVWYFLFFRAEWIWFWQNRFKYAAIRDTVARIYSVFFVIYDDSSSISKIYTPKKKYFTAMLNSSRNRWFLERPKLIYTEMLQKFKYWLLICCINFKNRKCNRFDLRFIQPKFDSFYIFFFDIFKNIEFRVAASKKHQWSWSWKWLLLTAKTT